MISTQVSFTVLNDVPNIHPPFKKGATDSVWVMTRTRDEEEVRQAAIRKVSACYGLEIKDLELYNQSGTTEV
jgi:hypothetical protein